MEWVSSSDVYGARLVLFLMLCMAGEAVAMAIAISDVPGIGLKLGLYSWTRHRIIMATAVPPTRILSISPGLVVIRLLYSCITILPMLTQRAQWEWVVELSISSH